MVEQFALLSTGTIPVLYLFLAICRTVSSLRVQSWDQETGSVSIHFAESAELFGYDCNRQVHQFEPSGFVTLFGL